MGVECLGQQGFPDGAECVATVQIGGVSLFIDLQGLQHFFWSGVLQTSLLLHPMIVGVCYAVPRVFGPDCISQSHL